MIDILLRKIKLTQSSIVILAENNNPSILNPDFLKHNNIVPSDYIIKDVLCTPPFAQVTFDNKYVIAVDQDKLQFLDNDPDRIPTESKIAKMAESYITTLPFVRYRALGINFVGYYEFTNDELPLRYLASHFLKDDLPFLKSGSKKLIDSTLKFTLRYGEGYQLTIAMRPGMIDNAHILFLDGNYHFNISMTDACIAEINKHLKQYNRFFADYQETVVSNFIY